MKVALIALVTVTALPAAASSIPALDSCGGNRAVRPSSVSFCGDGNFYLTNLKWSRWTASSAAASGQAYQNDCTPFCAAGHFHTYRVLVALFRVVTCPNGRSAYTRLSYRFVGARPRHIAAGPHVLIVPNDFSNRCG